ncbi:hypothetical protein PROFUN_11783 [Planoprotostelium fungivorum]|uniref:Uncharacterized protein n=1 Tax=Planoprotostelium fungivorum TaxID=1890364 RepID=A0A2P6N8N2_9EUKA|nr:hypothetical protein PROFUN_11783 [Planoprotostelium fungivorum]
MNLSRFWWTESHVTGTTPTTVGYEYKDSSKEFDKAPVINLVDVALSRTVSDHTASSPLTNFRLVLQ